MGISGCRSHIRTLWSTDLAVTQALVETMTSWYSSSSAACRSISRPSVADFLVAHRRHRVVWAHDCLPRRARRVRACMNPSRSSSTTRPTSTDMARTSSTRPRGHRAWDTMGEISVVVAAAIGISSLLFIRDAAVAWCFNLRAPLTNVWSGLRSSPALPDPWRGPPGDRGVSPPLAEQALARGTDQCRSGALCNPRSWHS